MMGLLVERTMTHASDISCTYSVEQLVRDCRFLKLYRRIFCMKKLLVIGAIVVATSFAVLGWIGSRIYQEMPPVPDRVITATGDEAIPSGEIARGQNVWQSLGGMEVGSIWGHGSYVAPDWTADWLHRELSFVLQDGPRPISTVPMKNCPLRTRLSCADVWSRCIARILTMRKGMSW
jgi:hypothetical protein